MIQFGQGFVIEGARVFRAFGQAIPPTWTIILTIDPTKVNLPNFVNVTGFIANAPGQPPLIPPGLTTPVVPS